MGIQLPFLENHLKTPHSHTLQPGLAWLGSTIEKESNRKEAAEDPWPRKGWLESVDHFINRGTFFSEVVSGRPGFLVRSLYSGFQ